MTKEEILAMEAGRELDKVVGEKVFGLDVKVFQGFIDKYSYQYRTPSEYGETYEFLPFYSTDISAAWLVVEKMCNWDVGDNMLVLTGQAKDPTSNNDTGGWWEAEVNGDWGKAIAGGKAASGAICKAALLVKLEEARRGA